ncbi:hypothetical protein [Planomonospora parontospora]|uniref:hypothetical protein n=1 Tax=Planomonospora parontospora TaxID=58119 RepID=UPI00166FC6D2|nr:hypothetical protein [Planomonospora parontospora]GGL30296.1 hypothetical protein GCM10014719_34600 [Planomonospora parontospora subsp. antibiotica]GII17720.1 hypothetical protein Ppa05_44460 [Planomonospora parontospora subsp. antibiotica]
MKHRTGTAPAPAASPQEQPPANSSAVKRRAVAAVAAILSALAAAALVLLLPDATGAAGQQAAAAPAAAPRPDAAPVTAPRPDAARTPDDLFLTSHAGHLCRVQSTVYADPAQLAEAYRTVPDHPGLSKAQTDTFNERLQNDGAFAARLARRLADTCRPATP